MSAQATGWHVGVDTGGTFTDLVEIGRDGRIAFDKTFSTPAAPEQGIFDVLLRMAQRRAVSLDEYLAATGRFAHGTTVSTNALIQRRGARVGLLTTHGRRSRGCSRPSGGADQPPPPGRAQPGITTPIMPK